MNSSTIIPMVIEAGGYYSTIAAHATFDYSQPHSGHGVAPDFEGSVTVRSISVGAIDLMSVMSIAHVHAVAEMILGVMKNVHYPTKPEEISDDE